MAKPVSVERVVAAPDKYKGTATASEVAGAIAAAIETAGGHCVQVPLADGGDGTLDALGGANRHSEVTGPLGEQVNAPWRLDNGVAVIEMAHASGLVLAGGKQGNDPLQATTTGVGELIAEAIDAGATKIIVGVGGSATTDGGLGAIEAIGSPARLAGVDLVVACDVRTRFVDAAAVFAPQKGASDAQVTMLGRRLTALADRYQAEHGIDVTQLERGGAAGGLAGGLAAFGASLVDGFDVVSEHVGLEDAIEHATLIVTGEGFLDEESFDGKVVGGVAQLAASNDVPVLAIAGQVFDDAGVRIDAISLADEFGLERAMEHPLLCITEAVANWL